MRQWYSPGVALLGLAFNLACLFIPLMRPNEVDWSCLDRQHAWRSYCCDSSKVLDSTGDHTATVRKHLFNGDAPLFDKVLAVHAIFSVVNRLMWTEHVHVKALAFDFTARWVCGLFKFNWRGDNVPLVHDKDGAEDCSVSIVPVESHIDVWAHFCSKLNFPTTFAVPPHWRCGRMWMDCSVRRQNT